MRSSDFRGFRGAGSITLFALASAVVLGILFYGANVVETKRAASALSIQSAHAPAGANFDADTTRVPRVNENGLKG